MRTSIGPLLCAGQSCIVCGGDARPIASLHAYDRLTSSEIRCSVPDCDQCGLGLIAPRPWRENIAVLCEESYPPWRAPTGLESLFVDAKAHVVARVPPYGRHRSRGSGRVLDVGLGRGDVARAFVTSGWETHGLDMSSTAVDVARSRGVDARLGTLDDPPCHLQNFTIPALNHAARAVGSSGARVRRCTSMVGLTISLRFAIAGKWAHGPKWRKRFLAASAASSPLVWAIGRLFGGTART